MQSEDPLAYGVLFGWRQRPGIWPGHLLEERLEVGMECQVIRRQPEEENPHCCEKYDS
jgi:hypothetical protein